MHMSIKTASRFSALLLYVILFACEPPKRLADLRVSNLEYITNSSCQIEGTFIDFGEEAILQYGFCYSTSPNPGIGNTKEIIGTNPDDAEFRGKIGGLSSSSKYYIKAYAQLDNEVIYSEERSFETLHSAAKPTVSTNNISNISESSANCGGNILCDGGTALSARGICWSKQKEPLASDYHTVNGRDEGEFSSLLESLEEGTSYYVRAYATNSVGTGYGEERKFTTSTDQLIEDFEGNQYEVVSIGNQLWMAENLKTRYYSDGTPVESVYAYGGKESHVPTYGRLYNWEVATSPHGLCPAGWHVPSDSEWQELSGFLGGNRYAGARLKEEGTTHWRSPNLGATNESGFTALPGGAFESGFGTPSAMGFGAPFWTSSMASSNINSAKSYYLSYADEELHAWEPIRTGHFAIRCIRD